MTASQEITRPPTRTSRWPLTPLPLYVRRYAQQDVDTQSIEWQKTGIWETAFADHLSLLIALQGEVSDHGGIRREFVFEHAAGDPVELFLLAMAWGFGQRVRWPRQQQMLTPPFPERAISWIVRAA